MKEKEIKDFIYYIESVIESSKTPIPLVHTLGIDTLEKLIDIYKHQKKVIDRLSRKIQELKKITGIMSKSLDSNYERAIKIQQKNEFLMARENKLQQIEQMFKSGVVNLSELEKLVKGDS